MQSNIAAEILDEHDYFRDARPVVDIPGLSSDRVCNFLNRLVARMDDEECYLEVGTWKGRTLLSAAHDNPNRLCIGCDIFRTWGRFTGPGFLAKRALMRNIETHRPRGAEVRFFHMSSRELFGQRLIPRPVGVYFYDGDHSYGGTFHGIVAGSAYLAERAIVLVDDWNDPVIRSATADALEQANLACLWRASLPGEHGPIGWWNGLGAFYVEKQADALRVSSNAQPAGQRADAPLR
jgi:hypothetical protein